MSPTPRLRAGFCLAMLTLALLVALLAGALPAAGQSAEALKVERRVSPASGTIGTLEFTVNLELSGDSNQCPRKVSTRPVDIVLAIDHSGSMREPGSPNTPGSKLDLTKQAAKTFLGRVDLNRDRIGVVEFDTVADVVQPLGNNLQTLEAAVEAVQLGSFTSIDQGVVMAQRELSSSRARTDASHIIVLLTDGHQESLGRASAPLDAAADARKAGIRIITIGLGADADQAVLRQMASQPKDFFYAPQASNLDEIYTTIATNVVQALPASNVVVEHTFDGSAIQVVDGSINPPATVNGNKITWSLKEVFDQPVTLSYRARPRAPGNYDIDRGDVVRYVRCGETGQESRLDTGLPVAVQAIPTNTPPPSPTPKPTLRATLPAQPTPLPTAPPAFFGMVQPSMLGDMCDTFLPTLLLTLTLLAFAVWWIWRLIRVLQGGHGQQTLSGEVTAGEGSESARQRGGAGSGVCGLIPWLFLPLGLILLFLILGQVFDGVCARESVYFWRINPNESYGQIFVTDKDGAKPSHQFEAVSQQGACLGCHAVSSESHRIAFVSGGGVGPVSVFGLDGKRLNIPDVSGSYVAWSPDGNKLAISTANKEIVILDLTQNTLTKLHGASDAGIAEEMPTWSPDGQYIAFVRGAMANSPWTFEGPTDIVVVPVSGGPATPLAGASSNGFNYYPSYSPDGRWIAFAHHTTGKTTYAAPEAEIFLVPSVGGEPVRLAANDGPNGTALKGASNSWPTWSRSGEWLAFNSKRNDERYDIFLTHIDANGLSGPAQPLAGAATPGIFEHLPFWGEPPRADPWAGILGLWPWLIPFLLVALLWWLCRRLSPRPVPQPHPAVRVRVPPEPLKVKELEPLWQVAPTLVVGVGGTGRWVLTHLKKTLRDGGRGTLPPKVSFVLLDTSEREEMNVFRDAENRIQNVEFAGVSLTPYEILVMGQDLSSIISRAADAAQEAEDATEDDALAGWFPYDKYRDLPSPARNLAVGTHGRRPMARAGLIDKLRQGANSLHSAASSSADRAVSRDAANLWETLLAASQNVAENNIVRIVVVGSLAGGMSGTLFDLAYLARLAGLTALGSANDPAATDEGSVHLEGYLTTPSSFRYVAPNYPRLQVNGIAAGREMQRFQLQAGFPYPMIYTKDWRSSEDADKYLDDDCRWRLFDDVTLFGDARLGHIEGKSSEPWATTFAAMADVISFRMDRAVNAGQRGDYRAGARADVDARQAKGQAVVSSAGGYVYRLPLVDILEIVQARWASKLFHVFLHGSAAESELSFDPAEAGVGVDPVHPSGVPPDRYARNFLLGDHEAGDPPEGMRAVGNLAYSGHVHARELENLPSGGRPFSDYLAHALALILNGDQTTSNAHLDRRAPRLGYALAFVHAVETDLAKARGAAHAARDRAPVGRGRSWWQRLKLRLGLSQASQAEWEALIQRIEQWLEVTQRTFASLQSVQPVIRTLYGELQLRQAKAEARRRQMEQVAVRRYVWAEVRNERDDPTEPENQLELVDKWYAEMVERLPAYLNRFYWSMTREGDLRLGIVTGTTDQAVVLGTAEGAPARQLADELMDLAAHLTQDWAEKTTLRDVLPTALPQGSEYPPLAFVQQSWQRAAPHLDYAPDANGALDGRHVAAAGIPRNVTEDTDLRAIAAVLSAIGTPSSRMDLSYDPTNTDIISTTDRTALTLVREHDLMPMSGLPEFRDAWQVYARNAGTSADPLLESASQTPVFASEHHALEYERRLEKALGIDFHILHPLVILGLARHDLAELYGLAFASGWLTAQAGHPILRIPGEPETDLALTGYVAPSAGLPPLVAGFLRFTAGRNADATIVKQLRAVLAEPNPAVVAAWRAFIDQYQPKPAAPARILCVNGHELKPGARRCGICGFPAAPTAEQPSATPWQPPFENAPREVRDLAAVAALMASRRLAPDRWDSLVMDRSRIVRE